MEMAGVVWVVRKARHMLQATAATTFIFTDHHAVERLSKHYNLTTTTCTDKLNLKLLRGSQYLSQFNIDVRYRPGRIHLVPDALSRLLSVQLDLLPPDHAAERCVGERRR